LILVEPVIGRARELRAIILNLDMDELPALRPPHTSLLLLLFLLALGIQPTPTHAVTESWLQLPEVDLSVLEPAVADQLRSLEARTLDRLDNETVPLEDLSEPIGDLGRHYHAYGLDEAAASCYRIARRLDPEAFQWPYLLGYLMQSTGDLEAAESAYLEALNLYRSVPQALLRLGEVYRDQGKPEAAEQLFLEALSLDEDSAAVQAALGEFYGAEGRYDEAIRLLETALTRVPDANRLYYPLALAYRGRGDIEQARELMARRGTVGLKPADPVIDPLTELKTGERAYLLAGQTAFRAGRYEEAVAAFRKAVAAAPDSVAARVNLGSALGEMGDVDAALVEYDRTLEIAPENPTALFNAGRLRASRGEIEAALAQLRSAADNAPEDVSIRLLFADLLNAAGDPQGALNEYRAAADLDPDSESARLGEAQVLVSLYRFSEARDVLELALSRVPTSGLLAHALSRLLSMAPDAQVRDGARALELAEKVFAARPETAYAEVVAAALAELGRCDEAVEWQRQVVESTQEPELAVQREGVVELYSAGPPCRYPTELEPIATPPDP